MLAPPVNTARYNARRLIGLAEQQNLVNSKLMAVIIHYELLGYYSNMPRSLILLLLMGLLCANQEGGTKNAKWFADNW